MGGAKWRKAKRLLGFRGCVMLPPTMNNTKNGADPPSHDNQLSNIGSVPSASTSPRSGTIAALIATSGAPMDLLLLDTQSAPTTPTRSPRFYFSRNRNTLSRNSCSICLETMKAGHGQALFTAECSHNFHFSCICSNVKHGSVVCPVCRADWKEIPFQQNRASSVESISCRQHVERSDRPQSPIYNIRLPEVPTELSFPDLDPVLYDDDEPLMILLHPGNQGGEVSDNEDFTFCSQPEDATSSINDFGNCEERLLSISSHAENQWIAVSEARDHFHVLLHVKAPSINNFIRVTSRAPIDLVAVLDVSGSMAGSKLDQLKQAMAFVVHSLSEVDWLSVVTFSMHATRIMCLRRMSEAGREHALQTIDALLSSGGTNLAEGLRKGAKVLDDRRERNPVAAIMLFSDGRDTCAMGLRWRHRNFFLMKGRRGRRPLVSCSDGGGMDVARIPIHTFGFGVDHDATALHSISEVSGGTFSFLQSESQMQEAFAQCLGGLLSMATQDVRLMVFIGTPGVRINNIQSGSYESKVLDNGAKHGIVKLGDVYAEEERDILVNLRIPSLAATGDQPQSMLLLRASCIYHDPLTGKSIHTSANEVHVSRSLEHEHFCPPSSLEVDKHKNRLSVAMAIAEAKRVADKGDLGGAQMRLRKAIAEVRGSPSGKAGDPLCAQLDAELEEIQDIVANRHIYQSWGHAYLLCAEASHMQQRASTRGHSSHSHTYETSSMHDMITLSHSHHQPSSTPIMP